MPHPGTCDTGAARARRPGTGAPCAAGRNSRNLGPLNWACRPGPRPPSWQFLGALYPETRPPAPARNFALGRGSVICPGPGGSAPRQWPVAAPPRAAGCPRPVPRMCPRIVQDHIEPGPDKICGRLSAQSMPAGVLRGNGLARSSHGSRGAPGHGAVTPKPELRLWAAPSGPRGTRRTAGGHASPGLATSPSGACSWGCPAAAHSK